MKSKDFEIRTPFLGVGDPLTKCIMKIKENKEKMMCVYDGRKHFLRKTISMNLRSTIPDTMRLATMYLQMQE